MCNILKNSSSYLLVFVIFFILYLRDILIADAIRDLGMAGSYLIFLYLAGLFGTFCLFYIANFKANQVYDPFLKYFARLFIIIDIISILWGIIYPTNSITVYFTMFFPAIAIYVSYFGIIHSKDEKFFFYTIIIGLAFLSYTYFQYSEYRVIRAASGSEYLASSYFILYLAPIILASNKRILSVAVLILTFIIVLSSTKRGGTIAFVLAVFVFIMVKHLLTSDRKSSFKNFIVFFILVTGAMFYAYDYVEESDLLILNRLQRLSTDTQDESRYQIWNNTLNLISNSNLFQFLFGHGYNAVLRENSLGFSAHNDFLEVLYDFGFLIFIAYINLHVKLYKKCIYLIKERSAYSAPFAFSVVLFTINSMVSHIIIYPDNAMSFAMVWSVLLGLNYKSKNKNSL